MKVVLSNIYQKSQSWREVETGRSGAQWILGQWEVLSQKIKIKRHPCTSRGTHPEHETQNINPMIQIGPAPPYPPWVKALCGSQCQILLGAHFLLLTLLCLPSVAPPRHLSQQWSKVTNSFLDLSQPDPLLPRFLVPPVMTLALYSFMQAKPTSSCD